MGFGKKNTEARSHFHHILSWVNTINITYHWWCWPWLSDLGSLMLGFSTVASLSSLPLHTVLFGWKSLCTAHTYKDGELCSTSLCMKYYAYLLLYLRSWVCSLPFLISVQSLSNVWLFVTPWTAARQASLSITTFQSLFKFMSIESVGMRCHPTISSSVIPFSSCPQSFPASGSFPMNQLFASGGQSIGALASASVLPLNIQDWFPLR